MAGESDQISQDEIEQLLSQASASAGAAHPEVAASAPPTPAATTGPAAAAAAVASAGSRPTQPGLPASDIDFLFRQAEEALASVQGPQPMPPGVTPYKLTEFGGAPPSTDNATLELLRDVELDLKIELGRTNMYLEDVLRLSKGAVVPLDRLAGDPVDIYVNGRLIARGEVLILNDNFCVRVAELVAGESPAPSPVA
jgi:flagellar motor switch protein FliN/FliY